MTRPETYHLDWVERSPVRMDGIPFAFDEQGNPRDVDDVQRGLACECVCPACRQPVIARQGEVRIHHFAHQDRRECRHALEASLFGMATRLLTEPNARLKLPPCGERAALATEAGAIFNEKQTKRFLSSKWVVERETLAMDRASVLVSRIDESSIKSPDLTVPCRQLAIHLISHQKTVKDLLDAVRDEKWSVLALDLRSYAQIWWKICDEDKEGSLRAAERAKDLMRHWLADQDTGRGWLLNRDYESRREKLFRWVSRQKEQEESRKKAEERHQCEELERVRRLEANDPWRIPLAEYPATARPEDIGWIGTAKGLERRPPELMKPIRPEFQSQISERQAASLGLMWHNQRQTWVFAGLGWSLVPIPARSVLDPQSPWEFVTKDERDQMRRPQIQVNSRAPVEADNVQTAAPSQASAVTFLSDDVIRSNVGTCVICGAATHEFVLRSGPFVGRRAIQCSREKHHPVTMY